VREREIGNILRKLLSDAANAIVKHLKFLFCCSKEGGGGKKSSRRFSMSWMLLQHGNAKENPSVTHNNKWSTLFNLQ